MNFEEQLAIRMTTETRQKLEQRAAREQRPVTQMARIIIQKALQKEKIK